MNIKWKSYSMEFFRIVVTLTHSDNVMPCLVRNPTGCSKLLSDALGLGHVRAWALYSTVDGSQQGFQYHVGDRKLKTKKWSQVFSFLDVF